MNIAPLWLAGSLLLIQPAEARLAGEERANYVGTFMSRCLAIQQQGLPTAARIAPPRQAQITAYCRCGADRSADELSPGILSLGGGKSIQKLAGVMEKVRQECLARFPQS